MRTIKIDFVDFWDGFNKKDNFFYNTLSEEYKVIICDKPDYLFYSVFGIEHRKYNGIKIFYTGECETPDFDECDYAIGFDYISFGDRYCRMPNYLRKERDISLVSQKHLYKENILEEKTGFCCFCYSNANAKERNYFFRELSKYKKVDSGGSVFNNIGYYVGNGRYGTNTKDRDRSKIEWQKQYKFCIAFENTDYIGYTTEKLPQAFAAQTIPIYWGNPAIEKEFNGKAFINCHRFATFRDVVNEIKKIDQDDSLYLDMLKERAWDVKKIETDIINGKKFLIHICSQNVVKARRRCHGKIHDVIKEDNEKKLAHTILYNNLKKGEIDQGLGIELLKAYWVRLRKSDNR